MKQEDKSRGRDGLAAVGLYRGTRGDRAACVPSSRGYDSSRATPCSRAARRSLQIA